MSPGLHQRPGVDFRGKRSPSNPSRSAPFSSFDLEVACILMVPASYRHQRNLPIHASLWRKTSPKRRSPPGTLRHSLSQLCKQNAVNRMNVAGNEEEPKLDVCVGQTELPSCPVCLERLDQHISGIVTTVSFVHNRRGAQLGCLHRAFLGHWMSQYLPQYASLS